mmetsp:Transcript_8051/g.23849  ORF Transcript_8051/g.23849 Transcript_8051/m.23849 type:complete len:315 (-) Transcript_8051:843-1787(-)
MATERSDFSTASAAQSDAAWYFIDSNRAYRGPISGETLHFLYSTNAITKQTYVFTEKLSSSRQWTRIRKIDWLYKSLEQPTASSRAASQRATAQPVKEAAGEGAGQEAGEAPASPASKSPSPASPPRTLGSAPAKGAAGMLPAGAAAGASLSERLIGRGSAAKGATGAATSAEPSRTMSLAAGKRWLGLGRRGASPSLSRSCSSPSPSQPSQQPPRAHASRSHPPLPCPPRSAPSTPLPAWPWALALHPPESPATSHLLSPPPPLTSSASRPHSLRPSPRPSGAKGRRASVSSSTRRASGTTECRRCCKSCAPC